MFFIAGLTGQVGGAAAKRLLAQGHAVRAMVRDPQKAAAWAQQGVDVRQGDFNDTAALAAAMDGVEGAFLMLPPFFTPLPGFPEAKAMSANFREAVRLASPPRLIALSAVGAQQSSALGMITSSHLLETALGDAPCPTAFVRAGSFLENYIPNLQRAAATGWFDSFLQPVDRGFPMIASQDIGNEVARLLTVGWRGRTIVELGSLVSADDLAHAMGAVLGREVKARAIPRTQWEASLKARGLPDAFIAPYLEMEDSYNAGWIAFGVPGAEQVAGTLTPAQIFALAKKAEV